MSSTHLTGGMSIGVSAAHVRDLAIEVPDLPEGFAFNVGHIDGEPAADRLTAVRSIAAAGFHPTLHLAARRFTSELDLTAVLTSLPPGQTRSDVFVIGGDPVLPAGPYRSALDIIDSGLLHEHGVRTVSIGGHSGGHPRVPDDTLWNVLQDKARRLTDTHSAGQIITQLALDPRQTADWIHEVRRRGITLPIRVGVPGPLTTAALIAYAEQFGVTLSPGAARAYDLQHADPQRVVTATGFMDELASMTDLNAAGVHGFHTFTFGDLASTSAWVSDVQHRCV